MRGSMGTRYEYLGQIAQPVAPAEGHSNYFSAPQQEHDPRLFETGTNAVRENIRLDLLNALYSFWETRYINARAWSTAWIAGSALGSQWSVDSDGKGDLDVLIGVDMAKFFEHNPGLKQFPEATIARHMNTEFREELWPAMADYDGNWEVTFYVNPKTGNDIRRINPYAAYNLCTAEWDVEPIDLPASWSKDDVPAHWQQAIDAEVARARELIDRYNATVRDVAAAPQGPRRVNLINTLSQTIAQITELYDDIHAERRNAFQGRYGVQGEGFLDYFNFRWQMHKLAGTGPTMNDIKRVGITAERARDTHLYGTPPAQDVLTPVTLKDYL